jgi:type IV secretion system protein VirB10
MSWLASRAAARSGGTLEPQVAGERGTPVIVREQSLQSRLSNLFAIALMLLAGVGFLLWYYTHAAHAPARARQRSQALAASRVVADGTLPPLGPVTPPAGSARAASNVVPDAVAAGNAAAADAGAQLAALPLTAQLPAGAPAAPATELAHGAAATPAALPSALQRRLSGAVFARISRSDAAGCAAAGVTAAALPPVQLASDPAAAVWPVAAPGSSPPAAAPRNSAAGEGVAEGLPVLLQAGTTPMVRARMLAGQRLLLPKGAFIDCTLETAIDSTLPGMTTCVTATDTFGADGDVVLLDRGTKLVGETRGQVQQGAARVFVLWTEARTPGGVLVPLDSPGADELGRSGLAGEVDRHFWQRFGAAVLISTIDGAVQAAVQSASRGTGTVIYNPAGSQDVMTEVLKGTLNIAPTVVKHNGDRIQVLVARDVDFSSVYELRHADSP